MEERRSHGRGGTRLRSGDVKYYLPCRRRPSGHHRAHQLVLGRHEDWRRLTCAGATLQRVYCFGRVCESQPAVSRWQVAGSAGASWSGVNRSAASMGRTTFIHSQHSEPLTVPFSEGIKEKGIREFTWKLSLPERDHEAWAGLVKAGFDAENEPITVNGVTVRPTDVLQAVIDRNMKKNANRISSQEVHEIHFAIGQGTRDGKPCQVTCRVIGHPDPLYDDYVDAGTSMNMSIGVQQMLSKPMKPGVWAAEEYFEAEAFFAELRKRHSAIKMETQVVETF